MYFDVQGIVIQEKPFGETSKHLSVLTAHRGVIFVTAKGVKKLSAKNFAVAQLFAFSDMTLYGSGPYFTLTDAKLHESFYPLRNDPIVLSLACYLSELASICATVSDEESELLRLFLNTLWFLQQKPERHKFAKVVFELRLMFGSGYMPEFVCSACGCDMSEGSFNIATGDFICSKCKEQEEASTNISSINNLQEESITAMKYIAMCDLKRLFAFTISDQSLKQLSILSEEYVCYRVDGCNMRLHYYKDMTSLS